MTTATMHDKTLLECYRLGRHHAGGNSPGVHSGDLGAQQMRAWYIGTREKDHPDPALAVLPDKRKDLAALIIVRQSGTRQLAMIESGLISYVALDAARVVKPCNVGLFGDHQIEMF